MGQNDSKDDDVPELDDLDPSSGTRKKSGSDELKMLTAQFRQRAQGLEGAELEDEIQRFMNKLIERAVKIAPEAMKGDARALLLGMLENDPTLQEMLEDLRKSTKK